MIQSNEFKKRVIYQIYPASFKDSNNDGWGDLKGIISKLDYLKDLGIGIIWLSPIYESPMDDMGYDISNYKKINPRFGTLDDFDELVLECKKRDILVVMDLVINHTSTEHEWFKEAIKDTNHNEYRDYYIFAKGKGKKMPNNWQSAFTGTCWKLIPGKKDTYYMHLFCDTQADLNYKNEKVIQEVESILKFWLDRGVYGFRCDVINNIYKTTLKNDYSKLIYNRGSKYYANQPGMFDVLKRFRNDVLDKYDTFLIGETGIIDTKIGNKLLNERCLDMFFEFDHVYADKSKFIPIIKKKFKAKNFAKTILKWQNDVPWIANYLENHDQLRSVSRYGNDNKYHDESAKMLAIFLLTLRGTPFIFEGEEIGTKNITNLKLSDSNDVAAHMAFDTAKKILPFKDEKIGKMINETINRDHARTTMSWDNSINAGFNEGHKTWINLLSGDYQDINVENEESNPNSILSFYKKIIKFRNNDETIIFGDIKPEIISNKIVSYYRTSSKKNYLILLNFSDKKVKYDSILNLELVVSNYSEFKLEELPPYFGGIFEVN